MAVASAPGGDTGNASILLCLCTASRGGAARPQRDATGCLEVRWWSKVNVTVRKVWYGDQVEESKGGCRALTMF